MFKPNLGAYPTMITPYNSDGSIDVGAVRALTEWYYKEGCAGIFAVCQSSEIHKLTLDERILLAREVKETADKLAENGRRMTIVASGHISDSFEDQKTELREIAATGVDSLIMISNRFDIPNTTDEAWCEDVLRMVDAIPDIPLGIYECPRPYKRLLTPKMIDCITKTGRFAFTKDTCCDAAEIDRRIKQIASIPVADGMLKPYLFNANGQTMLETLRSGGAGYCGIMANFHPSLYVWLCENWNKDAKKAELVASFLSQAAFIEQLTYPAISKYHLNKIGVSMTTVSRTCDVSKMGEYDLLCVDKLDALADYLMELVNA